MIGTKRLGIVILATLLVVGVLVAVSPGVIQADDPTPSATETILPTATVTILPTATATILPTATLTILPTATVTILPTATQTTVLPIIAYTPGSLNFIATEGGTAPAYKTLSIWNAGAGTMHWTATSAAGWLSLVPNAGTLTSTSQIAGVNVYVDITSLTPGIYSGLIGIFSSDASNSPQMFEATLTVRSVAGSVTPNVSATATATLPTATLTATPTATPPPGEGGGVPPWVWPVVGVLAVICATLAGFALVTTGVLGKLSKIGKGGAAGAGGEDVYEGGGDSGGETGDYNDEV